MVIECIYKRVMIYREEHKAIAFEEQKRYS